MTAASGDGLEGTEETGRIVDRRRVRFGFGGGGWRFLMTWEEGIRRMWKRKIDRRTSSSSIRIASKSCRRNSWASCCLKSRY